MLDRRDIHPCSWFACFHASWLVAVKFAFACSHFSLPSSQLSKWNTCFGSYSEFIKSSEYQSNALILHYVFRPKSLRCSLTKMTHLSLSPLIKANTRNPDVLLKLTRMAMRVAAPAAPNTSRVDFYWISSSCCILKSTDVHQGMNIDTPASVNFWSRNSGLRVFCASSSLRLNHGLDCNQYRELFVTVPVDKEKEGCVYLLMLVPKDRVSLGFCGLWSCRQWLEGYRAFKSGIWLRLSDFLPFWDLCWWTGWTVFREAKVLVTSMWYLQLY